MILDPTNWLLVFLRVGALLAFFPLFSIPNIPVRLRVALAAFAALLIAPGMPPMAIPRSLLGLIGLMSVETGIGLLMGFVCRLVFYTAEFAGSIMAMEIGLNMAASISPMSSARSEVPAMVLFYMTGLLFLSLDLHHWILVAFQRSYQVLPMGGGHLNALLCTDLIGRTGQLFLVGMLIAAPVIAVSFLVNLVFSILGRAVPQINIFVESFAFRILTGLGVFGLTLHLMSEHLANYLRRLPDDLLRVAQLLAGG
jgi:flagellar biosynthesis protein FliR